MRSKLTAIPPVKILVEKNDNSILVLFLILKRMLLLFSLNVFAVDFDRHILSEKVSSVLFSVAYIFFYQELVFCFIKKQFFTSLELSIWFLFFGIRISDITLLSFIHSM